jgi:hypothetical protein
VTSKLRVRGATLGGALLALAAMACGGSAAPGHTAVVAHPPKPAGSTDPGQAIRIKLPEWTYWEPIDVPLIVGNARAPDLPLSEDAIERRGGAGARWEKAPAALKDDLKKQAFGVVPAAAPRTRMGAYYAALRDEKVPWVITVDALFWLTHLAIDRALADVESQQLIPALDTALKRLDLRLAAESKDARADLAPAYVTARGLVAVASALARGPYVPAPELAEVVAKEKALVLAHAGPAESPLLGVSIDYSAMAPRGMADRDEARAAYFRAMAWLGQAPLMLAGLGEEGAAGKIDVAQARTHARAALLVTRLLDYDVDAEAAQAWERIDRLGQFIAGSADDLTPKELGRVAVQAGDDLKDARWIGNVAKVDHVRHLAVQSHVTRLFDGAGGVRAGMPTAMDAAVRAAPSVRLVGGRASPDGEVLQGLVFPMVGAMKAAKPPPTARDGERAVPTGLDIAAWLGSTEARFVLRETGDDAYDGYEQALDRLYQRRPPANAVDRHSSLYVSALDALATYVGPSGADPGEPGVATSAFRRRKIEVTLSAWTSLRHDAMSFSRLASPQTATAAPPKSATPEGDAFVEAHPEAAAKLLALVRQAAKGLTALGALPSDSPARAVLAEVDDLLWVALGAALHEANDEPFPAELASALAALPARMAALEERVATSGTADVPMVVDVHTDLAPGRVLEEATGYIADLYLVVPEPRSRKLVLAVGASIPHYELTQPAAQRLSDSAWRARLQAAVPPVARDPYVSGYVVGG